MFRRSDRKIGGFRSASRTHVGRVRSVNEDRCADRSDLRLWAVADGMGGHDAGDVAADFVIAELTRWREQGGAGTLRDAVLQAHQRLLEVTAGNGGTTLVAMVADGNEAVICWAGDSRAYLVQSRKLRQLTRDHSVVQQLLDAGLIDAATGSNHPQANVVTSALGTSVEPLIECTSITAARGDLVLLCSDGLSRSLKEKDIAAAFDLSTLADYLIEQMLERDGHDNGSLVLVEFT